MSNIKTKHESSIVKAITWRAIATLTTTSIVFIATSNISLSLCVGFFDVVIKLALYYFHERAWGTIDWGIY